MEILNCNKIIEVFKIKNKNVNIVYKINLIPDVEFRGCTRGVVLIVVG